MKNWKYSLLWIGAKSGSHDEFRRSAAGGRWESGMRAFRWLKVDDIQLHRHLLCRDIRLDLAALFIRSSFLHRSKEVANDVCVKREKTVGQANWFEWERERVRDNLCVYIDVCFCGNSQTTFIFKLWRYYPFHFILISLFLLLN